MPHDVWRSVDNPFEWLCLSDRVWALMSSHRGTPNRMRHASVVAALEAAGFDVAVEVDERFDRAQLESVRNRLSPRFVAESDESLLTRGAVLRCRR